MSTPAVRAIERTRVFTVLGLSFRDAAFDAPVTNPLVVHAWLPIASQAPVRALRSSTGVYSFHGMPGRIEAEYPAADEDEPESAGPELEYTLSVEDPAGHYLPVAFSLTLPLGYRGEFPAPVGSPPVTAGRAYLFPAPSRPVPPGCAVIRADLVDVDSGEPAAWAVLRVTLDGLESVGMADERGRVLILAALPAPDALAAGSPPGAGEGPLGSVAWPVTLTVQYQPTALRYPFEGASHLPAAWQARPSLKSILDEQGAALFVNAEGDAVGDWTAELQYGVELVLRSGDAADPESSSIWITAGASIP